MRRRFRKLPRLDKSLKITILIYVVIFFVAFILFYIIFNFQKSYTTSEMSEATLPVISSEAFDSPINELHGYITNMDACYMRDSVIPLDSKRNLPLSIKTFDNKIEKISYEVRSTDMERKIAETKIESFNVDKDGTIKLDLQIENLIEEGEEYLFIITLETNENDIHYYTRVTMPKDCHENEIFKFVNNFHNTSLNGNYNDLASYMETSDDANLKTLSEVTLQSSVSQVGFAGFDAKEVSSPITEIKDINSDYSVIEMTYQLELEQNGSTEYYNVKEYYKARYTPERIFLLDYRRSMEQILNKDTISRLKNYLNLGITLSDVNYLSNEAGSITCFEQAGELYEYNQSTGELIKIFSFLDGAENDSRCYYNEHSIKILDICENGDVTFAVYGYMNRGPHEGYSGIDLYKYKSSSHKAIEEAFVATTCSYQILNASFSDLLYKANDKFFYVMISGNLVKINLDDLTMENILEGLSTTQYAASKSGRYIAYTTEENKATSLIVEDLSNESTFTINADKGQYIRPLAFMDEDLVYGLINKNDIDVNIAGSTIYPISEIYIIQTSNSEHPVLKEYKKDGYFVINAEQKSFTLYLDRVIKTPQGYVSCEGDTIKNSAGELGKAVEFIKKDDSSKGQITFLRSVELDDNFKLPELILSKAKMHFESTRKTITVQAENSNDEYFVYVGSQVVFATNNPAEAIKIADEQMGIVVNNNSNYVWKRGKKAYVNAFNSISYSENNAKADNISKCISAMLSKEDINMEVQNHIDNGDTPYEVLKNAMKNYKVLDLTGCTLNEMLYYVSIGNPVYARTGDSQAVLIIGYDAANITIYNPSTNSYSKMGLMDATQMFEANNNVFITYIKK